MTPGGGTASVASPHLALVKYVLESLNSKFMLVIILDRLLRPLILPTTSKISINDSRAASNPVHPLSLL